VEKYSLVGVINGKEHADDLSVIQKLSSYDLEQFAQSTARKLGHKSPYGEDKSISVAIYKIEIKTGKLNRQLVTTKTITLDQEPPTVEQFDEELANILEELPQAFRSYVSSKAWDDGHSSGYGEVLNYAREHVATLLPCILQYAKDVKAQPK
jgi:hypothetical protein